MSTNWPFSKNRGISSPPVSAESPNAAATFPALNEQPPTSSSPHAQKKFLATSPVQKGSELLPPDPKSSPTAQPTSLASTPPNGPDVFPATFPQRIVSTVPSITETLFALGLGPRVVGVSQFCHEPPQVNTLPRIGSLYQLNVEAILELQPDLVLLLQENTESQQQFQAYGIPTLSVDHRTIHGVLDSFVQIGRYCGPESEQAGKQLQEQHQKKIKEISDKTAPLPRPSVLISIDHDRHSGTIDQVYIAGNNAYFNELLDLAGGQNIARNFSAAVPIISREGILELNPEIILDFSTDGNYNIIADQSSNVAFHQQTLDAWNSLGPAIQAVQNHQIYPILDSKATIPGPRFIWLLEQLAKILHPDQFPDE